MYWQRRLRLQSNQTSEKEISDKQKIPPDSRKRVPSPFTLLPAFRSLPSFPFSLRSALPFHAAVNDFLVWDTEPTNLFG